jgi:hypothetical protein
LFDVTGLAAFVTTTKEDDQLVALLHEIDPITGAIVDSCFTQPFSDGLDITKIPFGHAVNSHLNTYPGAAIGQLQ